MKTLRVIIAIGAALLVQPSVRALADDFGPSASWEAPSNEALTAKLNAWLDERKADEAARQRCLAAFAAGPPTAALDRVVAAVAALDEPVAALRVQCQGRWRPGTPVDWTWLDEPSRPEWLRADLKLYAGRWAAQERLYDESLAQIGKLDVGAVSDPATLLFYQSVGFHRLLDQEAGAQAVERLLERESELPQRFVAVARLLRDDFHALEEESLDHISRRMDDIERRLDLGRAGPVVRKIEDGVIESLDKLIKKEEDKQKQQAAAAAAAGGGSRPSGPSNPAQDSMPMELKAPGQVNKRNVGQGSGWGNLDPKQREEALQQIGQDFPAHYREVIEQYFRNLATQDESAPK
ncbi:MAG: hypothetical protein U0836_06780 [Pirellulales bacterium]